MSCPSLDEEYTIPMEHYPSRSLRAQVAPTPVVQKVTTSNYPLSVSVANETQRIATLYENFQQVKSLSFVAKGKGQVYIDEQHSVNVDVGDWTVFSFDTLGLSNDTGHSIIHINAIGEEDGVQVALVQIIS